MAINDIIIFTGWTLVGLWLLMVVRNIYVGKYDNNVAEATVVIAHACGIAVSMAILRYCPDVIINLIKHIF